MSPAINLELSDVFCYLPTVSGYIGAVWNVPGVYIVNGRVRDKAAFYPQHAGGLSYPC